MDRHGEERTILTVVSTATLKGCSGRKLPDYGYIQGREAWLPDVPLRAWNRKAFILKRVTQPQVKVDR